MVSENYDFFKCKSCGARGNLDYLQRYMDGQEYDPLGRIPEKVYPVLPKWRKWIDKYGSIENIAKAAHKLYLENPEFHSFFIRRGIDHYGEQGMFGWMDWWNVFPVRDQRGKVIDIVLRADKGKGDTKYVLMKKSDEHTVPPVYVPDWERFMMARTIYVPYGIINDYESSFQGRSHGSYSKVRVITLQPTLSYRLNDRVSIGGGPTIVVA